MTDQVLPGDQILYMKVGMHAQESLEDILKRKQAEIDRVGFAMWGYGGPTCHPARVQQHAGECAEVGRPIRLVMEPVNSKHDREPKRAEYFSLDNHEWEQVPDGINVLGSRYALCITNLREVDEDLPLAATQVAFGPSIGKAGDAYIKGRVDKACLEVVPDYGDGKVVSIKLSADLVSPWSVFLRTPD